MNAISKEVSGPNAIAKHSLLSDQQMESPPKRPKSSEGKTSANEQVRVRPWRRGGGVAAAAARCHRCRPVTYLREMPLLVLLKESGAQSANDVQPRWMC